MRIAARTAIVLLAITLMAIAAPCQQTSEVITPQVSVFSQTSTKSRVLRTLEKGQRVLIDMTISNSEGTWCLVREPESKEKPGYIPCAQLTNDALPKAAPTVPVFNSVQPATDAAGRDLLAFSDEQKAASQRLLEASGLEALRDDLAATYRRYGVTDAYSLLDRMAVAARNPYGDSFLAVVGPKIRRGGARYKAFWKADWALFSDEQKNLIAKRNPNFVLDYLFSQSDPESAFNGWVLGSMQRNRKK